MRPRSGRCMIGRVPHAKEAMTPVAPHATRPTRSRGMSDTTEQLLAAGEPLEPPRAGVGHASTLLVDAARGDRLIGVDCWYPAQPDAEPPATYAIIPGVGFTAAARADAP